MTISPKPKHIKSHNVRNMSFPYQILLVLLPLFLEHHSTSVLAIRANKIHPHPPIITTTTTAATTTSTTTIYAFREAPAFRNAEFCDSSQIKIAMTLDANYIRGTIAAVLSILQHTSCPEDVTFFFISGDRRKKIPAILRSTFPYLNFRILHFEPAHIHSLISPSIRRALDQPLNYARIYLADLIPEVDRVLYLDSDVIVVDDVRNLWEVDLAGKVVGAPEYCHTNFTKYFTEAFWSDNELSSTFNGRRPCYFNTGVMVVDLKQWRTGEFTRKVEEWMTVQKKKRIYQLGSLPPFMLVLAGRIKAVDHEWNQHGLGGDNIEGKCRKLQPGKISLLHWSGKGKPWLRLDSRKPCVVDYLWAPYDLYRSSTPTLEE